MSRYALETLGREHDRKSFRSGRDSVDAYLRETARGHQEKGMSVTRVMVEPAGPNPRKILGFYTLTFCEASGAAWPGTPKGLPTRPLPVMLLGRLGVDVDAQGQGLGGALVEAAKASCAEAMTKVGGIGLVVDAGEEKLVAFYEKFGFVRTAPDSLRLFLPLASLLTPTKS